MAANDCVLSDKVNKMMRNKETVPVCPSHTIEQFRLNSVFGVVDRFFFVL
jgi:hypothetical protein